MSLAAVQVCSAPLGPSLANAVPPVTSYLANPFLRLFDVNGNVLAENDNWQDDPIAAGEIESDGLAPTKSMESAILANLVAGNYTAIVSGIQNSTGVGLVEVYHVPTPSAESLVRKR